MTRVKTIGERIKEGMAERGITSERQLAISAGVSTSALNDIVRGNRSPSWEIIQLIADALDKPLDFFREK